MSAAKTKFVTYLENKQKEIENGKILCQDIIELNDLLKKEFNLKSLVAYLKNDTCHEMYKPFEDVEKYLEESLLNKQEKIEILFWIVEKIGKAVKVTLIREIVF